MTPAVPEGGDQLGVGALHPGGHLVRHHHCDIVVGRHGDEPLGEAAEQAGPLRELVKERPEGRRHAVDHQEADLGVIRQEAGQQVKLCQELSVVVTTDLRETTDSYPQWSQAVTWEEYSGIVTKNTFDRMDSTVNVSMATRCSSSPASKEQ